MMKIEGEGKYIKCAARPRLSMHVEIVEKVSWTLMRGE